MEIRKTQSEHGIEFFLAGRVDGATANQLEIDILAVMREDAREIYVNLTEATFLCSAALRVLLQYFRQMKQKGKLFRVANPSPEARSALEMTGFAEMIEP
jgi:anti-anti-sigma factor